MTAKGIFASLVLDNQIPKVMRGIEKAVMGSFKEENRPGYIILVTGARDRIPTHAEVKRRTEMCLKIFRTLRGDLSWSVERIVDHLPIFLRKELDGQTWEPEAKRGAWAAASK